MFFFLFETTKILSNDVNEKLNHLLDKKPIAALHYVLSFTQDKMKGFFNI